MNDRLTRFLLFIILGAVLLAAFWALRDQKYLELKGYQDARDGKFNRFLHALSPGYERGYSEGKQDAWWRENIMNLYERTGRNLLQTAMRRGWTIEQLEEKMAKLEIPYDPSQND